MLNTVHVAAAVAIVTLIPDPYVSLPLALASHIVLDTVPHWNWHPAGNRKRVLGSVGDFTVAGGLALVGAVNSDHPWIILIASFLSTVPDLIQGPYYFWKYRPGWLCAFIAWESRRQKWTWMKPWMGLATQAAVLVVSLIIMWK